MEPSTQTLVIDSRVEATTQARRWITQQARQAGFDTDTIFSIELAIGEALTNVIKHAYDGQAGHEIHLSLAIDATKLNLTIRDFGRKFDPVAYRRPPLGVLREGGYGVYLIEQMMDEVNYDTSTEIGTQLQLVKYRPEANRD